MVGIFVFEGAKEGFKLLLQDGRKVGNVDGFLLGLLLDGLEDGLRVGVALEGNEVDKYAGSCKVGAREVIFLGAVVGTTIIGFAV